MGIACKETRRRTMDCQLRTMTEAFREAQNIYGTQLLLSDGPPKIPQGELSIQEVGTLGKCLTCDKAGH